jgi:hypothetical protein
LARHLLPFVWRATAEREFFEEGSLMYNMGRSWDARLTSLLSRCNATLAKSE